MTATSYRRLSRVELSILLAFESGTTTLADAARALKLTTRELIDLELDAIAEGRQLARELADNDQ